MSAGRIAGGWLLGAGLAVALSASGADGKNAERKESSQPAFGSEAPARREAAAPDRAAPPPSKKAVEEAIADLGRKYRRTDDLPPWPYPEEAPPKAHSLTIRIGRPAAEAVTALGPPTETNSVGGLIWRDRGVAVQCGWVEGRASLGLITAVEAREGFEGSFYGLRIGDPESKARELWGRPPFDKIQYRAWRLEGHGVELVIRVADGRIREMTARYLSERPFLRSYSEKTGSPNWQTSP